MMSNFWMRTLTGFFFVAFLVAATWFGLYTFWLLLSLIVVIGLPEYANAFRGREDAPPEWPLLICGFAVFGILSGYFLGFIPSRYIFLCLPVGFLLFLYELYSKSSYPFQRAAVSIGGIVYIAVSVSFFAAIAMRSGSYRYQLPLGIFILIWSSDTFAYLSGRAFGKHPLFPRISPKKTWEGSIGGALCTIGISIFLFYIYGILEIWQWPVLALTIVVFGTWGDLVESMLKRSLGLKDSGNILPGHGGILDRFDSLLFSLPFLAAALYFFAF